jgi:hypothetical protein
LLSVYFLLLPVIAYFYCLLFIVLFKISPLLFLIHFNCEYEHDVKSGIAMFRKKMKILALFYISDKRKVNCRRAQCCEMRWHTMFVMQCNLGEAYGHSELNDVIQVKRTNIRVQDDAVLRERDKGR